MSLEVTQHRAEAPRAAFYYDFTSPAAYLAAERVLQVLGDRGLVAEWIPIRSPRDWADGLRCAEEETIARAEIERRAAARGLQPVRWPAAFDSERALRAATYAKAIGRVVAFSLAAFRQAYAGGHDLGDPDIVVIAGSACEMHPRALLQALERDAVARALDDATALAAQRGVADVPALWLPPGRVLHGDDALDVVGAPEADRAHADAGRDARGGELS